MELCYQTLQRIYKKGTVPLLFLSIKLPHLTEEGEKNERINAFYQKMEQALVTIAEDKIYPRLLTEYEQKRAEDVAYTGAPYHLSLLSVCKEDEEGNILCERRLTLTRRGKTLKERTKKEIIKKDGLLLPFSDSKHTKKESKRKKEKKEKARE